jgi:hypothetical protein
MATTSFTAGEFTLSGWVSDFSVGLGTPGTGSQFSFGPSTTITPFTAPDTLIFGAGPGGPQQVGIIQAGGSDTVQLTISFETDSGGSYTKAGTALGTLMASTGDTLTLGGATGESQYQLISQLRGLTLSDPHTFDQFALKFTLTDFGTDAGTQTFSERFESVCYAPGTQIATPTGEVAVEDLQIGDLVSTTSGTAKPVKWVGRRSHSAADVASTASLQPVVVRAGALGNDLPHRDLVVSPMHALLIDEVFVPAAALVNGTSIVRGEVAGPIEYIHIELDQHEVIFAEGTPAETFVDDASRAMFDNVSEYYDLYGIAESRQSFSVARVEEGYQLEAIRRRIAGMAPQAAAPGALAGHVERLEDGMLEGWVMDRANPTAPVELEVLVDGEIVATMLANRYRGDLDHAGLAGGRCGFTVAMPASAESLAQVEVRRAGDGGQVAMPKRALVTA